MAMGQGGRKEAFPIPCPIIYIPCPSRFGGVGFGNAHLGKESSIPQPIPQKHNPLVAAP